MGGRRREGVTSLVIVSNKERKKERKKNLRKRKANIKIASHTMRSNELDKSLCFAKRNGKQHEQKKKLWLIVKYITQ